jgi:hypothetical protein
MEITYEITELDNGGYGVKVSVDGAVTHTQDFAPGKEGFQPMTKEEAEAFAQELVQALKA